MLPAPKTDRISLADVLPSCVAALTGSSNRLGLPPVKRAVVLLVDGLGVEQLRARAGHARTLTAALTGTSVIDSGFPTTTAAALATLTTGVLPGQHGLVGYTALDATHDRVINQLTGWDDRLDPASWQRVQTIFESSAAQGVRSVAIGPERYRDSGFSRAVLRGAEYIAARSIHDRLDAAQEWMRSPGDPGLLYVYVPELDMAAHNRGWESPEWTDKLETLDGAVRTFSAGLRATDGLIVTADHGMVDVPQHAHVLIDSDPSLLDGVRHVAGDPRCLQLHFEPDLDAGQRELLVERWRVAESGRAWIATRAEAIAAGWFGAVAPEVEPRLGDLLVAARKNIAYYDGRTASGQARTMVGQHGSWSTAETRVPLLRLGAFAR
ncbi:type I phosphodiesterase/nucleotide pyrophosphatase [Glaciihabitans tibetensis]|uniref:Type I phosphodiesterase/nucleotide pyrophosphatase n=1 Tax=Glaciihabitans tibetensis TaxID=1266600 RepID=A0A2T0VJB0_9MICO|nr:alkaline phosphatase family protein [Glaciihabitans tibetensis]PRY70321.1 type I phosphodiesterase/nucleotide pyrophosphatase [Glaciihabitans tibetensis]